MDRRLAEHQTGTRRVVIAIRARKGRTLTFVTNSDAEGVQLVKRNVLPGTVVFADEARHWDVLGRAFVTKRIDHKAAYSLDGSHTNNAESFFARLRRMVRGQHHFASPKYLHQYATHAAWLEDHRMKSNGALCYRLIRNSMAAPISRDFKGYWQRKAA